jgi:hypothetical protein
MQETIEVPKAQLENLLAQNKQYKADKEELIEMVKNIVKVLGLSDEDGNIKEEITSGEVSPMKTILKKLSSIVLDLAVNPKKIEKEFEFVKNVIPILARYAVEKQSTLKIVE